MYLGLDGTGVPVRPTEVAGRRGKQPDGSAKTREVKLATVWTAEGRDAEGRPCRDPGSVSYNAAVESAASRDTDPQPAAFPRRAHREAQRRGFVTAARQVIIGDGAPWIWNLAAYSGPNRHERRRAHPDIMKRDPALRRGRRLLPVDAWGVPSSRGGSGTVVVAFCGVRGTPSPFPN